MQINWGTKIAILYLSFVALIVTLVVSSMHQKFDLVSKDYYKQEIEYQRVIDASKNQAALSAPVAITKSGNEVIVNFPQDFKNKSISGTIQFYSPIDASMDKQFNIAAMNNSMAINNKDLQKTNYKVKLSWQADGKNYYQESDINMN
ncbi:MAG: FixH family protein [Flavipsychrobacter sp.]